MTVDRHAALRACALLRDFTDVGIRIIAEACEERPVARGAFAFRAGEESRELGFVASGTVHLLPPEGGEALGELSHGDSFGGLSLLGPSEHLLGGVAQTDLSLLMLGPDAFASMEKNNPRTALKLRLAISADVAERLREAKGPLREFLAWQLGRRQG